MEANVELSGAARAIPAAIPRCDVVVNVDGASQGNHTSILGDAVDEDVSLRGIRTTCAHLRKAAVLREGGGAGGGEVGHRGCGCGHPRKKCWKGSGQSCWIAREIDRMYCWRSWFERRVDGGMWGGDVGGKGRMGRWPRRWGSQRRRGGGNAARFNPDGTDDSAGGDDHARILEGVRQEHQVTSRIGECGHEVQVYRSGVRVLKDEAVFSILAFQAQIQLRDAVRAVATVIPRGDEVFQSDRTALRKNGSVLDDVVNE